MTRWKSFTVETRREAVDAISHFLLAHGSLGTAYDEQHLGPSGDPADPIPPPPHHGREDLPARVGHELQQAFIDGS